MSGADSPHFLNVVCVVIDIHIRKIGSQNPLEFVQLIHLIQKDSMH